MTTEVELQTSGNIWKVLVESDQAVSAGETLFIMEVMKMEVPHAAPCDGKVSSIHIAEGDEGLDAGMVAVTID